jgi:hypothetical protein
MFQSYGAEEEFLLFRGICIAIAIEAGLGVLAAVAFLLI